MPEDQHEVKAIPLNQIDADEDFNCRGKVLPIDVVELAESIRKQGLLQAVLVAKHSPNDAEARGKPYRLIAGFRRFKAHEIIEAATINASIIDRVLTEADAKLMNLAENVQRKDLTILQEANALRSFKNVGVKREDVSKKINKSSGWVQIRYMLLDLPEDIQREIDLGIINQTQLRELYSILKEDGKEAVYEAAKEIKLLKAKGKRVISVNPNKKKINKKSHRKRGEIFDLMNEIQEQLPNGFWSRCLAWCAGEITTMELHISAKEYALEQGLNNHYQIPLEHKDG